MTTDPLVRPPPPPAAPDDFDAGMTERWTAWKAKGRAESADARGRLSVAVTVVGAAALAGYIISIALVQ